MYELVLFVKTIALLRLTVAISESKIYTAHTYIELFEHKVLPQAQLAETEWIEDDYCSDVKSCPYSHITQDSLHPTVTAALEKASITQMSPETTLTGDSSPKIIGHTPKVFYEETESLLQEYMRAVLDIYDARIEKPGDWTTQLNEVSQKLLVCDVGGPYKTVSGVSLKEYREEVQKAIIYLKMTYRTVEKQLHATGRREALAYIENQLKEILKNTENAVHSYNHAAIMEQKWRSYFLVSLANERLSPLQLEDHAVLDRFCDIYRMAYNLPTEASSPGGSSLANTPCAERLRRAFQVTLYLRKVELKKLNFDEF
ncbi:hypothetical protein OXX59_003149 [Metschnikowia pulcherrima]